MNISMLVGLLQNVAILLAFTLVYDLIWTKESHFRSLRNRVVAGLILGGVAILLMLSPFTLTPGLVFDTRTVLLVNTGLFFGPVATIIASVIAAIYRMYMGGVGMWMGLATIVSASLTGLLWKRFRPDWKLGNNLLELTIVSYIAHILMLCSVFLIVDETTKANTFERMTIPILTIYPLFSILVGRLLLNRMRNHKLKNDLEQSEIRYDSFINRNSDMMFMKDNNRRYVVANDMFCEIMEKSREELIGLTDDQIFGLEVADKYRDSDIRVMTKGEIVNYEEFKNEKITETTKFPISLGVGRVGVGAIIRDVTIKYKKREMQDVLLYLSRLSLVDHDLNTFLSKVHFHMKRVIKADNFYIALYHKNEGMYSFPYFVDEYDKSDYSQKEPLENSFTDYIRIIGKGMLITRETELKIAETYPLKIYGDDSKIWMGAPLMDSSLKEVIGVVAVQDYHDEKAYNDDDLTLFEIFANTIGIFIEKMGNIEKLMAAKEQAEKSDRLKTSFLANMSHEIRTPLNGIIGFADILLTEIEDPNLKEYTEIINSSAHRLLSTINDVMDIAKIEAGQMNIIMENFDIAPLIRDVFNFFAKQPLKIDLKLSLPEDGSHYLSSDKIKIHQILINLVNNAIKFTNEGYVEVGYKEEDGSVLLFVKDTGIGISPEDQKRIFERFTQVDSASKRVYEGTGLGLSIVKEFTHMLGGEVWVESKQGEGSIFYLRFKDKLT
ncbi:MAG: ATP-binding protein [Bacteroidales bacterium]